jgi:hypothetical protein
MENFLMAYTLIPSDWLRQSFYEGKSAQAKVEIFIKFDQKSAI